MGSDIEQIVQEIQALSREDQQRLRDLLNLQLSASYSFAAERSAEEEFQQRLIEAGLLREIKHPRRDPKAFMTREPVTINGKDLSKIILEERR
jgi:hypothetical protein